ncbi:HEAT repeat-containing protein 1 homolog [Anopheles maculipalpis]|uniref:HEAT repeat-containing protein 1 homolog n=1 Tax=Anopheles maculipalpis TaxID=1496333 RepID=UPI0021596344|nr:HEAT repeat-containing protein 1 homolog [Anopheles maculipalpis]
MATSLAAQLKRLAAPQTSAQQDFRKSASILFDAKEAASKDREVIFDIGVSGLEELIQMHGAFAQFEDTLFDKKSIDLQRSVENQVVNEKLDNNIKKFFYHLSPYFMLQPAHKCLEWLIRRFEIHKYNRVEFVHLILPYHETRIFVRCVQTMQVEEYNDKLAFLAAVGKSGVPPSKRTIIDHCIRHPTFLKTYGKFVSSAVLELGSKANALQATFAFYSTTTLGMLHSVETVTENQVVAVLNTVGKGLTSRAIDFAAGAFMIVGQMVVKTNLAETTIEYLIRRVCGVQHPALTTEATMLLVLIFQTQHERMVSISKELMDEITRCKWLTPTLCTVKSDGVDVIVLYRKLLEKCLYEICCTTGSLAEYSNFCEHLMLEIQLTDEEAEDVIQCVLDSYFHKGDQSGKAYKPPAKTVQDGDTIDLDTDEEDYEQKDQNVIKWYSDFLKSFERQYPVAFDKVVKRVMKGQYSHKKRNALRNVLGFLLQASYNENETSVFENLFHYDAERRKHAVEYLVKNMRIIKLKSRGKMDLLRDSVRERLEDDSNEVVAELLKIDPTELVNVVGAEELISKLSSLVLKCAANQTRWKSVTPRLIELLTDERIYSAVDMIRVVVTLYPLLFPLGDDPVGKQNAASLLSSTFGRQYLVSQFYGNEANCNLILDILQNAGQSTNPIQVCFNILLLSSALPTPCSVEQADRVLDYAVKQLTNHRFRYAHTSDIQCLRENKLPQDLITIPIRYIIERVTFDPIVEMNFERQSVSLKLRLRIFNELLEKYCTIDVKHDQLRTIFRDLLKNYLTRLYPQLEDRIEFLSHFYTVHLIESTAHDQTFNFLISPAFQIRCQRLLNSILEQLNGTTDCKITSNSFINIVLSLTSESMVVRECGLKTIELIVELRKANGLSKALNSFLQKLFDRREELTMDSEQLSLVVFTIFFVEDAKPLKPTIECFVARTADPSTPTYIVCGIMDFMKLLDDPLVLVNSASKGVSIVERVNNGKDHVLFDVYESKLLQLLIGRFNVDISEHLATNEICQRLVTLTLACDKPLVLPLERKIYTPAIMMIEALGGELFETLPKPYTKQLLQCIVEAATLSDHPETNSATAKLFKNNIINAELVVDMLAAMYDGRAQESISKRNEKSKTGRKSIISVAPSEQVLSSKVWKCGVTLLEYLQNKKKLENAHLLVPKLFECLKYCLDFEEQSAVEYVKQIILSLLLYCIQKVEQLESDKAGDVSPFVKASSMFKVEQIVQCIRGTQNPQTHHHALLLLAHVARYVPEQVLHNMMEIFTFVGSSIVRQDDAYSFQIISKIIETIIPTIALGGAESGTTSADQQMEQVIPILKIFSDIILDVPEHRRILLYVKLLQTLGAAQYLWVFLGVLIESDVMKGGQKAEKRNAAKSRAETELSLSELSKRMEVALLIASEFEPTVIIQTCTNLIDYLRDLPMEIEKRKGEAELIMEVDAVDSTIFNVKTHNGRQLKHFKYSLVQFVAGLLSSVFVINKIAQLTEQETLGMKKYYQNLIVGILTYVNAVSKMLDRLKEEGSDEKIPLYWRAMLNNCYDILESTISLLSADTLIIVVNGLLSHRFLMVRRKVIELLNNKLQYKQDYFNATHFPGLLNLFDPLMALVKKMHEEENVVGTSFERMVIVQLSYIAVRHLSKILTQHDTKKVQSVLAVLMKELQGYKKHSNTQILSSLILCIGELCSNLGPYSINFLPQFMPMVSKFLNAQLQTREPFDILTSSIVLLTVKIVDTLARFISPYLCDMLVGLTKLYAMIEQKNDPRLANMMSRLGMIWDNLSNTISPRVLLPTIEETYHTLVKAGELTAVGPLMALLSTMFSGMKSSNFATIRSEVTDLFLTALQFRCYNSSTNKFTLAAIDAAEAHVIKAFVVLILKLSESTFRPLFYQVFEWSIRETASNDRAITFFNLCCHVAEALKSLFVLFASDLIAIAVKLLNATNAAKVDGTEVKELHFEVESKNVTLLRYVLKTLYCIVLYDNQNFINAVRFDMLLGPVTDHLENELIIGEQEIRTLVIDVLAQMAVAVMDDSLWRQLNYQVLMKTRNNDAQVRLFALEAGTEIARKLGESYAPLLPETIPFLAELMEDDNEDVEKAVHHSCREIGRATGEDLQKYF